MKWKADSKNEYFIYNWFYEMPGLKCMTTQEIGFMVTAYFIGFAANGLFSTMPDKYGRKKSTFMAMIASCAAQTVMLLSHNYFVRTAMFFIMGLS